MPYGHFPSSKPIASGSAKTHKELTDKKAKQFGKFKEQLISGIAYYQQLFKELPDQTSALMQTLYAEPGLAEHKFDGTLI